MKHNKRITAKLLIAAILAVALAGCGGGGGGTTTSGSGATGTLSGTAK